MEGEDGIFGNGEVIGKSSNKHKSAYNSGRRNKDLGICRLTEESQAYKEENHTGSEKKEPNKV